MNNTHIPKIVYKCSSAGRRHVRWKKKKKKKKKWGNNIHEEWTSLEILYPVTDDDDDITCSFRGNIRQHWSAMRSIPKKIFKMVNNRKLCLNDTCTNSQKTSVETHSARILGIRLPQQPNSVHKYLISVGILNRTCSCHPSGILNLEVSPRFLENL
jgi:hypothetical protein